MSTIFKQWSVYKSQSQMATLDVCVRLKLPCRSSSGPHTTLHHCIQSLPRVVGPYTLSSLCQRLYAKNLGKIRLLKGNLI
jgi:hypothetical protein